MLNTDLLQQKTEMYAMVSAIEADFVSNLGEKLTLQDISQRLIDKANVVNEELDPLLKVLKGLDIQSYIEICNSNIAKLSIGVNEKQFLNNDLHRIIPIRNAVMHPRPLGMYDYPMLKTVFDSIDTIMTVFSWKNLLNTRNVIAKHPETLIPPPSLLAQNDRIIHNLPILADYEETSFIGRKQEIGEIRAKLGRRNVNILSIIGDGGVGKTALVLKLLYDMLEDPKCKYELIIWVSLKTNQLSHHDFVDIKNSITSVSEMYERLLPFVGSDSVEDTQAYIIELAKQFETLFVLDNLETLNTSDIRDFIDDFSEYGKILITSRIGLGEMEHRYRLKGLNDTDVVEYANVLLDLYGYECYFTDEKKKHLFCDVLHANPLAIKWFIRCLANHQTEEEILAHKDDLVNFCMENVYDKLSDNARKVLDILTVASVGLTLPELMYYLDSGLDNSVIVRNAINELGKCNFISEDEFRTRNQVVVTDFARDFLSSHFIDVHSLSKRFKELEQKINSFGQAILAKQAAEPYKEEARQYSNKGELVINYFLSQALKEYRQNTAVATASLEVIKHTQEILPQFFECHLARASIYGKDSPLKAKDEFENAIKYAKSPKEKLRASLLYSLFLIQKNEYLVALDVLNNLEKEFPDCMEIHLEKAKALGCVNQFEEALKELDIIEGHQEFGRLSSKVISKRADIYRRMVKNTDSRKTQEKLGTLRLAFEFLEHANKDDIIVDHMVENLIEACHMYLDNDVLMYLYEKLSANIKILRESKKFKDFSSLVGELRYRRDSDLLEKIYMFTINISEFLYLLENNEVLVYTTKNGYGFTKNRSRSGIYFSMRGLPSDIEVGDIFTYTGIFETKNGPQLIAPKRISNIYDRIRET